MKITEQIYEEIAAYGFPDIDQVFMEALSGLCAGTLDLFNQEEQKKLIVKRSSSWSSCGRALSFRP